MRDGSTRKIDLDSYPSQGFEHFLRQWQATLVLVSGDGAGSEYLLDVPSQVIGRGDSAKLQFHRNQVFGCTRHDSLSHSLAADKKYLVRLLIHQGISDLTALAVNYLHPAGIKSGLLKHLFHKQNNR